METRHWAMAPPKFEIFLVFPYFPRSQLLSRSATREATRMPSLLYQMSRFVLLVVNRICTKTLYSSKILWPRLQFQTYFYFFEKLEMRSKHWYTAQFQYISIAFNQPYNKNKLYIPEICSILVFQKRVRDQFLHQILKYIFSSKLFLMLCSIN